MKRLLFSALILSSQFVFSQAQIGNSDFEIWETVASDEEPVNWNSFLTAQGGLSSLAANQIEKTTDIRPGSSGSYSARIWTRDAGFNIKANGNLTVGIINMGSISPTNTDNHNLSMTSDTDFSETLTDTPDSVVFWVKYSAASGSSEARMKATLHDDFDYTDPETGASGDHVVASAELNYAPTSGWVRKAVAFNYGGPVSVNTYILITFASNATPGGGDFNDQVFVDDVELIYNPSSIEETNDDALSVSVTNDQIIISSLDNIKGDYVVYGVDGKEVQTGNIEKEINFVQKGVYFVVLEVNNELVSFKISNF